jgi:NADH dehydrogenase
MVEREHQLVTVLGGGGFIGRYVCEKLMDGGHVRVRAASRHPGRAHLIQPLGQIGQWAVVRADVTKPQTLRDSLDGATAVINLVGVLKGDFQAIHAAGARNVAQAARDAGVRSMVHVSAIGADPNSQSAYGRTKGEGETAVREIFPEATIIRPSVVFGPEDDFTNRLGALGRLPVLPVIAPKTRFQPVFVEDLAKAIAKAALEPATHSGKTYEIAGPEVMTMRELTTAIMKASGRDPGLIDTPGFAGSILSRFGWLPGAPITRDQWLMLQHDNVASEGVPGLEAFGIAPTPFAAVADAWLGRYWRGGRFAMRSHGRAA